MQIRSNSSDGFQERPRADITRSNRDAIHRSTAENLEKSKESESTAPNDPAKRLARAREEARERHDHRLHRAREQERDEHDVRLRRARQQERDEHDVRLHRARQQERDEHDVRLRNARAQAAAEAQPEVQERVLGRGEADGLTISNAARELVSREHGGAEGASESRDPERRARLDEIRARLDRGELTTDELIARTAVRILSGEAGQ